MGGEFGQWGEWNHDTSLDWHLTQSYFHSGIQRLVEDLNHLYREQPALHVLDLDPRGFRWVDANDGDNSVLSFLRRSEDPDDSVLVILNFTPVLRENYRIGVPQCGSWRELLNSDADAYGGSGKGNGGGVNSENQASHGFPCSINLTLPPLGALFLKKA
jgi:1,4-alpha-glucan branching enzyme